MRNRNHSAHHGPLSRAPWFNDKTHERREIDRAVEEFREMWAPYRSDVQKLIHNEMMNAKGSA